MLFVCCFCTIFKVLFVELSANVLFFCTIFKVLFVELCANMLLFFVLNCVLMCCCFKKKKNYFFTIFEVLFANFPGTPPYEATKTKLQSNPIFHELLVQCNNPNTHTQKRFKWTLFIRTKHDMRIFQVLPFMKLQKQSYSAVLLENSALLDLFVVWSK